MAKSLPNDKKQTPSRLIIINKSGKLGGLEGTLLEPAHIVAKLLVERKYGRIFRLPAIRTADAPELNDKYEYIL